MKLINNQHFISLDQTLDLVSLDNFEEEICLGFAQSEEYISLASTPTKSILNKKVNGALQDIKFTARNQYPHLNERQLEWYSMIKGGESHGYILFLKNIIKYPEHFRFKSYKDYCVQTPAAKYFSFLFDWIEKQNCFDEYGRVLFFISHSGQTGMIHKDNVGIEHVKDQYIWITGKKFPKSIFIYDEINNKKTYAESRSVIFDNRNYHGTENLNSGASWSLRIDGRFSKSFMSKMNIEDHFSE